jgi:hypothetical protein
MAGLEGPLEWTGAVSRPTEHDKININGRFTLRNVRILCVMYDPQSLNVLLKMILLINF